jgi:hypothetical protein
LDDRAWQPRLRSPIGADEREMLVAELDLHTELL